MVKRYNRHRLPQFTFTSDFHELVEGDVIAGPARLRYDPFRLVPTSEFRSPGPVNFYVRFLPLGTRWEKEMTIPSGALDQNNWDPSGQGFMLEPPGFNLPEGCDELEFWFSYRHSNGMVAWDSDYGKNFHLRFPLFDLNNPQGTIIACRESPVDELSVQVEAITKVEAITLRWRLTAPAVDKPQTQLLMRTGDESGGALWTTPPHAVHVPRDATAVYDFLYQVGGRTFKDDNTGRWYLAQSEESK